MRCSWPVGGGERRLCRQRKSEAHVGCASLGGRSTIRSCTRRESSNWCVQFLIADCRSQISHSAYQRILGEQVKTTCSGLDLVLLPALTLNASSLQTQLLDGGRRVSTSLPGTQPLAPPLNCATLNGEQISY